MIKEGFNGRGFCGPLGADDLLKARGLPPRSRARRKSARLPAFAHRLIPLAALFIAALACSARAADDPVAGLETLPDFKLELLLAPPESAKISFISLAKDDKGRLLLGGQRGQSIWRLTLDNGKIFKQEELKLPVSEAMGILYAFDSLYVDGNNGTKFGLFRCRDTTGSGQFDEVKMIREWPGGSGEHGAHGVVLGPDQKLYVVCGNFTEPPADCLPSSPVRDFQDDRVLPRAEDGNGFGAGKKPPGGFIARMDPDGRNVELFAAGERNTYAIGFNPDGELFGFDSDMEYDWGTPWYRPIRVFHAVSGADHGFREGSAKWPTYYPDTLPPVVNVGLGSPTGVVFGTGARFPAAYQKAFYALDWIYGRLIAVHPHPHGASYDATWENFVAPKGLRSNGPKQVNNLTGVTIGDDGSLYFTTGGRSTQARLFRVTYTGAEPTVAADLHEQDGAEARALRRRLEAFHGHANPAAIELAWPQLKSPDRYLCNAARLAIESQPLEQWLPRALAETDPQSSLIALLSLARLAPGQMQPLILAALQKYSFSTLSEPQQLDALRVIEVSLSRQGKPSPEQCQALIRQLDSCYPAKTMALNSELSQILLSLGAPDAVTRTMKLLAEAPTQEEQVGYLLYLRTIDKGWTPELRKQYFEWFLRKKTDFVHDPQVVKYFEEAGRPYDNGSSYDHFIAHIHQDAIKTLSPEEAKSLAPIINAYKEPPARKSKSAPRKLVKEWKVEDLEPSLPDVSHARDFAKGKAAFEEAQCIACHRFAGSGGAIGPDLTAVSSRFARRDILESIILPSKVISEQYMDTTVRLKNGDVVNGRLMEENDTSLVFRPNPLQPDLLTVKKTDVAVRKLSKISPMPEGLVNTFHKEEILDLIAYLESGGRKDYPDFKK